VLESTLPMAHRHIYDIAYTEQENMFVYV